MQDGVVSSLGVEACWSGAGDGPDHTGREPRLSGKGVRKAASCPSKIRELIAAPRNPNPDSVAGYVLQAGLIR